MVWKPGQSGRPTGTKGTKPGPVPGAEKENSFTKALRAAICDNKFTITLDDGTKFSDFPKDQMAKYMASVMMTGVMRLPTGKEMNFTAKEWLETYWNIINRLDGPPIQAIDQTNHNILQFDAARTIFDPNNAKKNVVVTTTESGTDEVE